MSGQRLLPRRGASTWWLLVHVAISLASATRGACQETPPAPDYELLRYAEDWSFLRDAARRSDPWDPLKFIPLDATGDAHLSLGGAARLRYERYDNFRWNAEPPDGYWLQRYLLHADLYLGPSLRAFGQLQSSLEDGREGGPRATDENRLDLHQLFVDVRCPLPDGEAGHVTARLGRQELSYGSQRLVSVRESPNIRRAFDAARVVSQLGPWSVDVFLAQPVENDPGVFDDSGEDGVGFWGVYATRPLSGTGVGIDVYYLGLHQRSAEFVQATATEDRHSVGARWFGEAGAWDFDFEGVVQGGRFGGGDILAWTLATHTGWTWAAAPLAPRFSLRADVISGDGDPGDDDLGTFNALFPKGAYFGEVALIGPANLIDLHPAIALQPSPTVQVSIDWDVFWRYSVDDGIYDNGGNVLVGTTGGSHYIGNQLGAEVEWQVDRHLAVELAWSRFFAGSYLEQSGRGFDVDFVGVWAQYTF